MTDSAIIPTAGLEALRIIHYPDPRLRRVCTPVEAVDESISALVDRMFELMVAERGVGLAAPQVGVTVRMFVAAAGPEQEDTRVYVNPRIISAEGSQDEEEGCLSFPNIRSRLKRHKKVVIEATGLDGRLFQETGEDLAARIFEHERDHLDGILLVNRMSSVARLANRRGLKYLEQQYADDSVTSGG